MANPNRYLQAVAEAVTEETVKRVDNVAKYNDHKFKYLTGKITLSELYKRCMELLDGEDLQTELGWFEREQITVSVDDNFLSVYANRNRLLAGVFESLARKHGGGSIQVFESEVRDGLGEAIASCNAVAYAVGIQPAVSRTGKSVADKGDSDLFPIRSIMVTTGKNLNDDVFLPDEVWAARDTPEDKPLNMEHTPSQIVGHITGNHVADDDMSRITAEPLPAKLHVIADAVIYRHLQGRDADLKQSSANLIEEIERGEWSVSMECLFQSFDYLLGDNLIERKESTAFLTKHLRAYGGLGTFDDKAIGRVLRSLSFSALGIVKNPANPQSVFLPSPNSD